MRRLFPGVLLLVVLGTLFYTSSPAQGDEPTWSTSCVNGICATTPTEACLSDQGSCPFPSPVCWYEGAEPLGVKVVSCHRPAPPGPGHYTMLCIEDGSKWICVGGENSGEDPAGSYCPWVEIALKQLNTQFDCAEGELDYTGVFDIPPLVTSFG